MKPFSINSRFLLQAFASILLFMSLGFIVLAMGRSKLDYNSEGRYFDTETASTYFQHTMEAYTVLGSIGLLTSALLFALSYFLNTHLK